MVPNPVTSILKGTVWTPTCSGRMAGEMQAEVRELHPRAQGCWRLPAKPQQPGEARRRRPHASEERTPPPR